jgi:isoquinoline 1-oxidoreductase alpha subunit
LHRTPAKANVNTQLTLFGGAMPSFTLLVNGRRRTVDVAADTPLLWVLRDHLDLTGTKFGCGAGLCGACTVQFDGAPTRSCSLPVSAVANKKITTIEGLASPNGVLHAVQKAWIAEDVPQCGYCQSGQLMAAAALLSKNRHPSDAEIDAAMTNICRCGTYQRVRKAIKRAAAEVGT